MTTIERLSQEHMTVLRHHLGRWLRTRSAPYRIELVRYEGGDHDHDYRREPRDFSRGYVLCLRVVDTP